MLSDSTTSVPYICVNTVTVIYCINNIRDHLRGWLSWMLLVVTVEPVLKDCPIDYKNGVSRLVVFFGGRSCFIKTEDFVWGYLVLQDRWSLKKGFTVLTIVFQYTHIVQTLLISKSWKTVQLTIKMVSQDWWFFLVAGLVSLKRRTLCEVIWSCKTGGLSKKVSLYSPLYSSTHI